MQIHAIQLNHLVQPFLSFNHNGVTLLQMPEIKDRHPRISESLVLVS